MVFGAEKILRANIDGAFFIWTQMDRSVPVEAKLLFVVARLRLDIAAFQREPIYPGNFAAL